MTFNPRFLTAALCVAGVSVAAQAQAAVTSVPGPVATFSAVTFETGSSPISGYSYGQSESILTAQYSNYASTDKTVERRVTKPYVVEIYSDTTTTVTRTDHFAYVDALSADAQVDTVSFSGPQWLKISATVTATQDINLGLSLSTAGSYQSLTGPFGSVTPALPTLYWSTDGVQYTALDSYASTNSSATTFATSAFGGLSVLAGHTISFAAVAYAGSGVSLNSIGLSLSGQHDAFAVVNTDKVTTVSTLVATAPVPEPETKALMLAGLLALPFLHKRRRQA